MCEKCNMLDWDTLEKELYTDNEPWWLQVVRVSNWFKLTETNGTETVFEFSEKNIPRIKDLDYNEMESYSEKQALLNVFLFMQEHFAMQNSKHRKFRLEMNIKK